MKAECWRCGSPAVEIQLIGYKSHCKHECKLKHVHRAATPEHTLSCQNCGHVWRDGSGAYAIGA